MAMCFNHHCNAPLKKSLLIILRGSSWAKLTTWQHTDVNRICQSNDNRCSADLVPPLELFQTSSSDRELLKKAPAKSCELDPIPTELLKVLAPQIALSVCPTLFHSRLKTYLLHIFYRRSSPTHWTAHWTQTFTDSVLFNCFLFVLVFHYLLSRIYRICLCNLSMESSFFWHNSSRLCIRNYICCNCLRNQLSIRMTPVPTDLSPPFRIFLSSSNVSWLAAAVNIKLLFTFC